MTNLNMFKDVRVISELPKHEAIAALKEIEEFDLAQILESTAFEAKGAGLFDSIFASDPKPWMFTAHSFGFLPKESEPGKEREILSAGNMAADQSLENTQIKVTLNRLRVASYPGKGEHTVLFDFYARNQVKGGGEDVHFNSTFRVRDNSQAAIVGYPIFVGLNVGTEGVSFKCFTVNVKNTDDEKFLGVLDSGVFKKGLQLVNTVQPALALFSELAVGLTKSIASRNRNVPVQDFYMGLDFGGTKMGARLAQGDYISVQIPDDLQQTWRWSDWEYDNESGQIINVNDHKMIPYNYLVFGISKYEANA